MKTIKYLTLGLLTLVMSCNGQTKKENKTKDGLTEDNIPSFIEAYLIKEHRTGTEKLPVDTAIIDGKKEIYMDEGLGGTSYSLPMDNKEFLKGDITGDSKQDIIVSIGHSFGASGHATIYFLFGGDGDAFSFITTFDSFDLGLCKTNGDLPGQFYPDQIKTGTLIGTSHCYTTEDAKCCPSKKFENTFKYNPQTKKLSLIKQTEKK